MCSMESTSVQSFFVIADVAWLGFVGDTVHAECCELVTEQKVSQRKKQNRLN